MLPNAWDGSLARRLTTIRAVIDDEELIEVQRARFARLLEKLEGELRHEVARYE
jgi:hypothetical protein